MRLNENEISIIKEKAETIFGPSTPVFLFGSRVDDLKKGGDIDLFIETDYTGVELLKKKIQMITEIQLAMGERKIDIVSSRKDEENLSPIIQNARKHGIKL